MESVSNCVFVDYCHLQMTRQVPAEVIVFGLIDQAPLLVVEKRCLKMKIIHAGLFQISLSSASFEWLIQSQNWIQHPTNVVYEIFVVVYSEKCLDLQRRILACACKRTLHVYRGMTSGQKPCYIFGIQMVLCLNEFECELSSWTCLRMFSHKCGRKMVSLLLNKKAKG